jgi:regulator of protease activity HflC (stomatin/prohibitin superfamily)
MQQQQQFVPKRQPTNLSQRSILSIGGAEQVFNEGNKSNMSLVLVPWTGYLPVFTVPTGPYVLWQRFGKDMGILPPGLKMGWAPWNRISHIVTKAATTYDAPTYDVPTADNVMVNVDVSITFHIYDPQAFVYKIGANNFNNYLHGKIEEGVRGLVYGVTHNRVNDLRESFAESMRDNLKSTMSKFGVTMMNVKVTNVKLPDELQSRLEKTTAFQTKIEEAQKQHEARKIIKENDAKKLIEAQRKDNGRKLQDIEAEIERYATEVKEMMDRQRGLSAVAVTKARGRAETRITSAKGDRDVAKAEGERMAEEVVRSAAISAEASKVRAAQDSMVMIKGSEAELVDAKNTGEGMIAMATAESGASNKLKVKRAVLLEKKRLAVLQALAAKGRKIIAGKHSQLIMDQLCDGARPHM